MDDDTALSIIENVDFGLENVSADLEFKALNTDTSYQTAKLNLEDDLRSIDDGTEIVEDTANNGTVTRKVGVEAIANGVVINTTNFPLMKSGSTYRIALDGGGVQTGTEGTDTADDDGTLEYALDVETTEPYIETRESNVQNFEVATGVVVTQENTIISADLNVEVSQTLVDGQNDNREQGNKNADAISKLHRDFTFTFIQATWTLNGGTGKWEYLLEDNRILSQDEVSFAPDNDSEIVWFGSQPFIQGVQDEIAGQATFLTRTEPSADMIGIIALKGVVLDG
jgi:hypothetical protein